MVAFGLSNGFPPCSLNNMEITKSTKGSRIEQTLLFKTVCYIEKMKYCIQIYMK